VQHITESVYYIHITKKSARKMDNLSRQLPVKKWPVNKDASTSKEIGVMPFKTSRDFIP